MAGNEHITEVLCALWFDEALNDWDSTYFGKFHTKILDLGYTDKQEKKQVEFSVEIKNKATATTEEKSQMIFKNPVTKTAIILSKGFISFHKLAPYHDHKEIMEKMLIPLFDIYKSMGQGNGLKEVQWLYVNKYSLSSDDKISDVLKFWPSIEDGVETNILFQTKYELDPTTSVQLRLNGNRNATGVRDLFFECSTFVKACGSSDIKHLAQIAHSAVNQIYDKLVR